LHSGPRASVNLDIRLRSGEEQFLEPRPGLRGRPLLARGPAVVPCVPFDEQGPRRDSFFAAARRRFCPSAFFTILLTQARFGFSARRTSIFPIRIILTVATPVSKEATTTNRGPSNFIVGRVGAWIKAEYPAPRGRKVQLAGVVETFSFLFFPPATNAGARGRCTRAFFCIMRSQGRGPGHGAL